MAKPTPNTKKPSPRKSPSGSARSAPAKAAAKRTYIKQSDVPLTSLEYALRIPSAILDDYGGKPATPMQVATALQMDPKGS